MEVGHFYHYFTSLKVLKILVIFPLEFCQGGRTFFFPRAKKSFLVKHKGLTLFLKINSL
jgi:hypothetical protein